MTRKSNSAERRTQIVAALLETMAEHGYERATIQLIGKKAGLAPGLLHYHFTSKAEMLLALVEMLVETGRARYAALSAGAAGAEARLRAYIQSRLGLGEGSDGKAVAAWVVIGAEAVRQPEVREVYQRALAGEVAILEQLLVEVMAARGRSAVNVAALAAAVVALIEGAFQLASAAPGTMREGAAAPIALQLIERFIGAEPAA